jgi:very-short-patch-repair endonuclease
MDRLPGTLLEHARRLRAERTSPEEALWMFLRGRRFGGLKWRRQYVWAPYVLDFYCPARRLGVELDGGQHAEDDHRVRDGFRTLTLAYGGARVIRFWNFEVSRHLYLALDAIWSEAFQTPETFGPAR